MIIIYIKRLSFWFQIFTKKLCLIDSACKKIKGDSRSLLRIPSRTLSPFPSGRRNSIQSEPGKISQINTSIFLMYTVVILWSLCPLFAPMFPSLLSSRVLNSAYRFCSSPSSFVGKWLHLTQNAILFAVTSESHPREVIFRLSWSFQPVILLPEDVTP